MYYISKDGGIDIINTEYWCCKTSKPLACLLVAERLEISEEAEEVSKRGLNLNDKNWTR